MSITIKSPFSLSEYQNDDLFNLFFTPFIDDPLTISTIQRQDAFEKTIKEIYSPIYRLDSFKSLPIEKNTDVKKTYFHSPKVGIIFMERKKPRLSFDNNIQVFKYH